MDAGHFAGPFPGWLGFASNTRADPNHPGSPNPSAADNVVPLPGQQSFLRSLQATPNRDGESRFWVGQWVQPCEEYRHWDRSQQVPCATRTVDLYVIQMVAPEPATTWLALAGLGGLGLVPSARRGWPRGRGRRSARVARG